MSRVILALILTALSITAAARSPDGQNHGTGNGKGPPSQRGVETRGAPGPDEAVARAISQVNQQYGGRVLSATPIKGAGGRYSVRVKLLSDGVIKILIVNPD